MFIQFDDNSLASAGLVAGLVWNSFTLLSSISGSIASSIPGLITNPIPSPIISLVLGAVASPIASFFSLLKLVTPLIIDDIIRSFFIRKPVMAKDNSNTYMYMKRTIWIGGFYLYKVNNIWQYILSILDLAYCSKITNDITHQYMLLAQKMGFGYQNISDLLKKN